MFSNFAHATAAVNDQEIAFVRKDHARPAQAPVLLLHGFPQTKAMWAQIAPLLAQERTVVCADLRGYGHSSKPACLSDASNYSFRAMAADQVALMRSLGYEKFHLIGHDRGGRTAHRLALDHPQAVLSLTVMDIVPTLTVFEKTDRHLAGAYWHWFLLSQPAPFAETLIEANPDFFYETCLAGWGAAKLSDFDAAQLADYRQAWRNKDMIQATCGDYRAAATLDIAHDAQDLQRQVQCPSLVLYGELGVMHKLFNIPAEWQPRLAHMRAQGMPGGHFFPDQLPTETAAVLRQFLAEQVHLAP
jgi:haloacetate dehalogenase